MGSGEKGLSFDADDPGGTGVTHARLLVDDETVDSRSLPCEEGGCPLTSDFFLDTGTLTEGEHQLSAVAEDGAGNSVREDWTIRLERTAPGLTVVGPLNDVAGQNLAPGSSYQVTANGSDAVGAAMQSGLGSLSFSVDDDGAEVASQECELGGCGMTEIFEYVTDDHGTGEHRVNVTATDLAGNETTRTLVVSNDAPQAETCQPAPTPATQSEVLPAEPDPALAAFRAGFPGAFEPSTAFTLDGEVLQAQLDGTLPAVFRSVGTLVPLALDREASDGATTQLETEVAPLCLVPTDVSSGASDPTAPVNGVATLYANSTPGTDIAVRPTAVGEETFSQVRGALASKEISWHVSLAGGHELRELADGSVAVVEPAGPGGTPPAMLWLGTSPVSHPKAPGSSRETTVSEWATRLRTTTGWNGSRRTTARGGHESGASTPTAT